MRLPNGPRNLALPVILSILTACDQPAPEDTTSSQAPVDPSSQVETDEATKKRLAEAQAQLAEARDGERKALQGQDQLREQIARSDNGGQVVKPAEVVALSEEMEVLKGQLITALDSKISFLPEHGKWDGDEQKLYDEVCVPFLKGLADPKVSPELAKATLNELAPKVKNNPAGRQLVRAMNAAFGEKYRRAMDEPDEAEGRAELDTQAEYALLFFDQVANLKSFPFKIDVADNVARLLNKGVFSTEPEIEIKNKAETLLSKLKNPTTLEQQARDFLEAINEEAAK